MTRTSSIIFAICLNFYFNQIRAQRFSDQVPSIRKYTEAELLQGEEGILIFNKLCPGFGGDSVKYTPDGYNAQGWQEQFYANGKLLHRGYYQDGRLLVFKNYYENGNCERNFVQPDPLNSSLEIYYPNGKTRRHIVYYQGILRKMKEFYENGLPKKEEEFENGRDEPVFRQTWYPQGNTESELRLSEAKTGKYQYKAYFENGRLKEQGPLHFSKHGQAVKSGSWTFYDEEGKKKRTEKFQLNSDAN